MQVLDFHDESSELIGLRLSVPAGQPVHLAPDLTLADRLLAVGVPRVDRGDAAEAEDRIDDPVFQTCGMPELWLNPFVGEPPELLSSEIPQMIIRKMLTTA